MADRELEKEINQLPLQDRQALLEASWQTMFDELSGSVTPQTLEKEERSETYEQLRNSLPLKVIFKGLSQQDVELFLLYTVEGMGAEQIAEELGETTERVQFHLRIVRAKIRYRTRKYLNERRDLTARIKELRDAERQSNSVEIGQTKRTRKRLSQRLYGILKFDRSPPNEEEVKDIISDYLIRKYS